MKTFFASFLLLLSTGFHGQAPKPAKFPEEVHVISSAVRFYVQDGTRQFYQVLDVTINGQPMELTGMNMDGVLVPDYYYAKLLPPDRVPKDNSPYVRYWSYSLQLPDNSERTYSVTRFGPR